MTENKRIAYLDMARGIGMILVVMGHIEYVNMSLLQFIYAFHMPLFFLISGILIWEKQEEKNNYIALWKKKLRSILLPYCFFSVLILMIESARLLIKGLDEWENIGQMLLQTVCLQGISTLWFLPALFMSELLFIGMRRRGVSRDDFDRSECPDCVSGRTESVGKEFVLHADTRYVGECVT